MSECEIEPFSGPIRIVLEEEMVVSPEAKRKLWLPRSPKISQEEEEDESQNSDVAEIGRNILREFKGDFFRNEIKMMEIIYDSRQFFMENRIDRGLSLKIFITIVQFLP